MTIYTVFGNETDEGIIELARNGNCLERELGDRFASVKDEFVQLSATRNCPCGCEDDLTAEEFT